MKHLPNLQGLSGKEITEIIELGMKIKKSPKKYGSKLKGKTLALWFEKPSLRTRVSFEAGMAQLGGSSIYLDTSTTHSKANIKDETKCLSSYVDIIAARVFGQATIEKMQSSSKVPVINALSDKYHPCQALADIMTIYENVGNKKVAIAYIGEGNNVCNSLIEISKKLGIKINVASPKDMKPLLKPDLWTADPKEAVKDADVVYTDTWVSMGDEKKAKENMKKLKNYQVNKSLIGSRYFMHCLPAVRGNEVTDDVIDSEKSLVFEQAENRLHVQKAVMLKLLGKA